jgi:hypothetical protein
MELEREMKLFREGENRKMPGVICALRTVTVSGEMFKRQLHFCKELELYLVVIGAYWKVISRE